MNNLNRAAWFCPSCNAYHAPHCETCTGKANAISVVRTPVRRVDVVHLPSGPAGKEFTTGVKVDA